MSRNEGRHYARCNGRGTIVSVTISIATVVRFARMTEPRPEFSVPNEMLGKTMNRNLTVALIVVAGALGLSVTGAVLLQTILATWHTAAISEVAPGLAETLEAFVDAQIDAGFAEKELDARDPLLKDRRILISHNINARTARDVASRLLFLDGVDPTAPIDLYISTQGGWIDNAFTIIDAMRLIDAPVNTWAIGGCYSSGALILASGTGTRHATENAIIMVHADLGDSTEDYSFDRLSRIRYERVWNETSNLPEAWFPMTSDESYYLSPGEALEFQVIDAIAPIWAEE